MLGVPAEGQHAEAVEQGGEAAGPLGVVEVDRVDPPRPGASRRGARGPASCCRRRVESTRRTSGAQRPPATPARRVVVAQPEPLRLRRDPPRGPPRRPRAPAAGSFTSSDSSKSVPQASYSSASVGMCAGRSARSTAAIRRCRRAPTTPSWSSTASPSAVSQTSLSRPWRRAAGRERTPRACSPGRGPGRPGGRTPIGGSPERRKAGRHAVMLARRDGHSARQPSLRPTRVRVPQV